MRRQRGLVGLTGLAALVGLGLVTKPAAAAVTTEQSASILIFPKVVATADRDTIIQITNTTNSMRHAHCFYVNGALSNESDPTSAPLWTETDFDIWLTKQQPTHWVVSTGRLFPANVNSCRQTSCNPSTTGTADADCCDAGFAPGRVPPVVPGFTGELRCIEVDSGGNPISGNSLTGEATIEDPSTGDVSKYNAIGLKGFDQNNGDGTLCLGGGSTAACPNGKEYEGCPLTWLLDHPTVGAEDRLVGDVERFQEGNSENFCLTPPCSSVTTNLTIVPCSEDFEQQNPPPVTLQFLATNEYEQTFSASTTITCWASFDLDAINPIFRTGNMLGNIAQTSMRSAAKTPLGVVAVLEETHTANVLPTTSSMSEVHLTARSAQNAHTTFQDQAGPDVIVIPSDQITGP